MDVPLKDVITILISVASLLLSGYAIWVAQFNHGRLKFPSVFECSRVLKIAIDAHEII